MDKKVVGLVITVNIKYEKTDETKNLAPFRKDIAVLSKAECDELIDLVEQNNLVILPNGPLKKIANAVKALKFIMRG